MSNERVRRASRAATGMNGWLFAPLTSERLALLRVLTGCYALIYLLVRTPHFLSYGTMPARSFRPVGVISILDAPLQAEVVTTLTASTVLLAIPFVLGWHHRVLAPLFFTCLLALLTYSNSFGKILHTDNLLTLHVGILALSRSADRMALDASRSAAVPQIHGRYRWPIQLMCLVAVCSYFLAGYSKLTIGGTEFLEGDTLRNLIAYDNVRKLELGSIHSPLGAWLLPYASAFTALAWFTLALELGAPLALLHPRIGRTWALTMWSFHLGVLALMAIVFAYPLTVGLAVLLSLREGTPMGSSAPGSFYAWCHLDPVNRGTSIMTDRTIAGRFRIQSQLAVGGMGETFVAEQLHLKRRVVIKTIRREWLRREGALPRFEREAELAASVSHPNIVAVFDYALGENEMPYLVMEYVDGETLGSWAKRECTLEALVSIIRPILSGLEALHDAGILHRDIKPSNIMLQHAEKPSPALPPGIPKLIDFGLARLFESADMARLTRTGQIMGTPGHLAPEQVTGNPVDARTDLYAVAVVLYRCLARRFPYEGTNPAALIQAVLSEKPILLSALCPDLPDGFVAAVHQALEKSPEKRFQSAAEMCEALLPWDGSVPAPARVSASRLSVPLAKTVETFSPGETGPRSAHSDPAHQADPARSANDTHFPATVPLSAETADREAFTAPKRAHRRGLSLATWSAVVVGGVGIAGVAAVLVYQQLARQAPAAPPKDEDWIALDPSSAGTQSVLEELDHTTTKAREDEPASAERDAGAHTSMRGPRRGVTVHETKPVERPLPPTPPSTTPSASYSLSISHVSSQGSNMGTSEVQRWFASVRPAMRECFEGVETNVSHRITVTVNNAGRAESLRTASSRRRCLARALPGRDLRPGGYEFRFRLRWHKASTP